MQVPTDTVRRRFLCLLMSGGSLITWSMVGCGESENKVEMSPEAKKAVFTSKIGDESKFLKKTGKAR
jgi:hypothetical protein